MRKMFTTLKSVVAATVIAAMALAASCSYDDSGINQRVDRVEKDLAALTERVAALEKKLDEQVEALTKLINGKTVVTKVEAAEDGSTKVTLSDGSSFVVYPKAEESTNTEVATDTTVAPYKAEDGVYYWAIFDGGKFQKYLEVDGQKVPVFAAEAEEGESCACDLKFSVDEKTGKLLVSIDGGKTWVDSGLAAQQVASTGVFSEVVVNDNNTVTFTLADGEKFTVALAELIECEATRSGVYVLPGEVKAVRFTVNDAVEDINIMNQPHGWAATVEVAPVEEENGDENVDGPAAGPLAVGGTDYVLNIAGPAEGDKYAAKEGVVSVHFNTANGACKVLSVNVNLAELTLSIDTAGNITITNSVALEQTNYFGDKFVDFADFWIGIMPAELYEANGEDALQNDYFMWGEFETASVTNRTGGLRNLLQDDMAVYEEGVCEFETISITMEQLCQEVLYPRVNMTLGARYVVFLSLGNDTTPDAYIIPSLENAIVAEYSYVMADAKLVEGSESWNDATFDFALAGYTHYIVGWHAKSEVDGYISERVCDSYADYLSKRSMDYLFGIGAVISGNIDGEVALSKVIEDYLDPVWGEMCMIPQILTDTEYYFFVYPLNIQSEMDVYMHKFDVNALVLSSFATTALVEGEFAAGVTFGEPEFIGENGGINVPVTVTGDDAAKVVCAAYNYYDEAAVSVSKRVEAMLADEYYTEYVELDDTLAFQAYKEWGASDPTYLSVLLIDADGKYLYFEQEFAKPIVYTEFVYTQADFAEGVLTLKGETNKDAISIVVNPGLETLVAGDYVAATEDWSTGICQVQWSAADAKEIFANATSFDFTGNPNSYPYYVSAEFQMNVAVEGDVYTIVATDKKTGAGPVKFMYTGTFGIQEEETAGVVFTSATAALAEGQPNWHDITFANGTDTVVIRIATSGSTECLYGLYAQRDYGQARCINGYPDTSTWNGVSLWPVTMNVVDNGDGTLSVTIEATEYGGNGDSHVGTFTGVIEGLTFVHPEVAPEFTIPGDGETYDLDARLDTLVAPWDSTGEAKFTNDLGYSSLIKFNPGLTSIEAGDYVAVNQAFSSATALEFDAYNCCIWLPSGATFYPDNFDQPATLNVQKNEDWYCITMIGQGGYQCPFSGKWRVVYIGKLVK